MEAELATALRELKESLAQRDHLAKLHEAELINRTRERDWARQERDAATRERDEARQMAELYRQQRDGARDWAKPQIEKAVSEMMAEMLKLLTPEERNSVQEIGAAMLADPAHQLMAELERERDTAIRERDEAIALMDEARQLIEPKE